MLVFSHLTSVCRRASVFHANYRWPQQPLSEKSNHKEVFWCSMIYVFATNFTWWYPASTCNWLSKHVVVTRHLFSGSAWLKSLNNSQNQKGVLVMWLWELGNTTHLNYWLTDYFGVLMFNFYSFVFDYLDYIIFVTNNDIYFNLKSSYYIFNVLFLLWFFFLSLSLLCACFI